MSEAITQEDLFRLAANGSAAAQVELSRQALADTSIRPDRRLILAETFARMAACQSSANGFQQLAAVLLVRGGEALNAGQREQAVQYAGRAVAIFDHLCDAGAADADCALEMTMIAGECDGLKDEIVAAAKALVGMDLAYV